MEGEKGQAGMTNEEIRGRLLAEAEKAIDKVLADRPTADKIRLRDIERLAVRAGAEVSAEVQKTLGQEGSQRHSSQEQLCPVGSDRMQRRGQHARQVMTEAGTSRFERAYDVCPGCGHSFFRLG